MPALFRNTQIKVAIFEVIAILEDIEGKTGRIFFSPFPA